MCGLLAEEHSQWVVECDKKRFQLSGAAGASQLHQLIAYAPQNTVLFEASLRDNLLLGQEESEGLIETWPSTRPRLPAAAGGWPGYTDHLAQGPFSGVHRLGLMPLVRNLPIDVLDEPWRFSMPIPLKGSLCIERVNDVWFW